MERSGEDDKRRETVVALFRSQAEAEPAIQDLKAAGFSPESIGVVLLDPAYRLGPVQREKPGHQSWEYPSRGTSGGGILGGVVGLLPGVDAFALRGIGPVIAGGVLVDPLTRAGARGLAAALGRFGLPAATARYLEVGLQRGAVLVLVDAGSRGQGAREILRLSRGDLAQVFGGEDENEGRADDEPWRGSERRYRDDPAYSGPERRLTHP